MRKTETIKKAIARARKSHEGSFPVPKVWQDMKIPANFSVTARGTPWLALEETTDLSEKIIIFCSQEQKNIMSTADYWIADGTFSVVSKTLFSQLFIITSMTQTGITVPTLFALLPNKETNSYQRVFQLLKDEGVNAPKSLKTDFERAIIRGFHNIFPGVEVTGCDTHFKRSLRRKLTSTDYGLGSLYASNTELQTLVRYVWAMSLVPPNKILDIWDDFLHKKYTELSKEFVNEQDSVEGWLNYVEQTYIGQKNWRTGRRRQPTFHHSLWNKYQVVLDEDAMTSNAAEGFNAALALSIPRNCSIWTLIKQLQTEENSSMKKLMDAALGPQNNQATNPNTSRNMRKIERREDLKRLVSNYHKITPEMYMSSLIDFYRG